MEKILRTGHYINDIKPLDIREWRLEAASPDMLPKDPSDNVRRLLVATNASMENLRGLHMALVRQIHPDKCKDVVSFLSSVSIHYFQSKQYQGCPWKQTHDILYI